MASLYIAIVAAGSGKRMQTSLSEFEQYLSPQIAEQIAQTAKQYLPLGGKYVLEHSLDKFLELQQQYELPIKNICVAINKQDLIFSRLKQSKLVSQVYGGKERSDTVFNVVNYFHQQLSATERENSWIMVHDAARPLVSKQDLCRLWSQRGEHGAILANRAVDTIKYALEQQIEKTIPRQYIWQAQTPQLFRLSTLYQLFLQIKDYSDLEITDEASILEFFSYSVGLVESSSLNFKITNAVDLLLAEMLFLKN